jgi:beta-glucosidase
MDVMMWGTESFVEQLKAAYAAGTLPMARLSDMVRCILRSVYALGADKCEPVPKVDPARHHEVALETAHQGSVLLKIPGALPRATDSKARIAVIGGHAQVSEPTGTGLSAVVPPDEYAAIIKIGGPGVMGVARNLHLLPTSSIVELKKLLPRAQIDFDPGMSPAASALSARRSEMVIVFELRV